MIFQKNKLRSSILFSAYFLLSIVLIACNKKEKVWQFDIHDDQQTEHPPATDKDTAISVTAQLNNDTFKALGRAETPDGSLDITFFDFTSAAYLKIALGADTPGVYLMGRNIAAHTAVWYAEDGLSYTSRATDEAGGAVTIEEVDTLNHRLKGTFQLSLRSRTDSSHYDFKDGHFDILYNHAIVTLDGNIVEAPINETIKTFALSNGTAANPQPLLLLEFGDSLKLNLSVVDYKGLGIYDIENKEVEVTIEEVKTGKVFTALSGQITLVRFNYTQFLQLLIDCELKTTTGETRKISRGSIVIGK